MKTFLTLPLIFFFSATFAQVFPVQVSTQITPPYSPYFADYTAPGSQNFVIHINANDITLSDYGVRLRLTIAPGEVPEAGNLDIIPPPDTRPRSVSRPGDAAVSSRRSPIRGVPEAGDSAGTAFQSHYQTA